MTRSMIWMGFLATVLIAAVMAMAFLREPKRQVEATIALREAAVIEGTDRYAENCAACHGASGEGLGAVPALNHDGVRAMDDIDLFRTIERGRYNTAMAAYGAAEGGIFTDAQINDLITLVQYASWEAVAGRVDALGLTPPEVVTVDVSEEALAAVRDLPGGDTMAAGLTLFAENCAACHGDGSGTTLAPALNTAELRARLADEDIARIIAQGVPGTLMASWDAALSAEAIDALVTLIRDWESLDSAGVQLQAAEAPPIDMSPEALAEGQWLFGILCAQCHGANGYGSPMAPALNNSLFLSQTPDAAIQQIIAMGVSGTAMPAWGGRLTEADIAALAAYLRSWEGTAPAIVNP